MTPSKLYIEYELNGKLGFWESPLPSPGEKIGDENLKIQVAWLNTRFSLAVFPEKKLTLKKVKISGNIETPAKRKTRYFLNGWQSWTDSREYSFFEKEKTVGYMPKFINKIYGFESYGDYNFYGPKLKKGNFHGWTYAYVRLGDNFEFAGSLSEVNKKTNSIIPEAEASYAFALIKFQSKEKAFEIFADGYEIDYEISSPKVMLDLVFLSGTEESVFEHYFSSAETEKVSAEPVQGWTSWYDYYQNINEKCLMENIEGISQTDVSADSFKIFQIDDGYETFVGDWLTVDTEKFPNGLEPVVQKAKEKGLQTGIWFAPFSAEKKSRLFKEHPEWFCSTSVLCGCNWSGFYALDIYNEEVRDYIIRSCRHFIDELGISLLKIDFLYSACLIARKDKTRGQVMHDALVFFREASKGARLLGCGVPLGSAFGLVDYCRIGTDVSLSWDDKFYMRLCHRERPSTKWTIINSLYRRQLDGRAFLNDPDVFILRTNNEKLGLSRKLLLSSVNALAGSLVFTSDNPATYDEGQKNEFIKIRNLLKGKILSVENKGNRISVCYDPLDGVNGEQILRFNRKNGKIIK